MITSVKVSPKRDTRDMMTAEPDAVLLQHYIGNEQELYRVPTINSENQPVEAVSSNIDDKTMHELYLWPFQDALKAGAGNIMSVHQNNTPSTGRIY